MNIFIIAAQTIDGFIAKDKDHAATWTSKADKKHFIEHTKAARVMVMGSRTFATLPFPLKDRLNVVYTRTPETLSEKLPPELAEKVNAADNVMITDKEPAALIEELKNRGYSSVAICGGAEIYSMFLQSGLVKKLYITVEPLMFGDGISLLNKPIESLWRLARVDFTPEGTVFLEYDAI
jgi:dihydrofolate reductase